MVNGGYYDFCADIYSLGMVMYVLLNKQRQPVCSLGKQILSYQERVDAHLRRMRGEQLLPPVNASPGLSEIILKACAFRPEDRFASAAEMKKALMRLADSTADTLTADAQTTQPPVEVADTRIVSLEVESYPTRTSCSEGDILDLSGLMLAASYKEGKTISVRGGIVCDGQRDVPIRAEQRQKELQAATGQ